MKITDTIGRTLNIDVVVKAPGSDDWMQPLGYKLEDGRQFLRVPHGPFALRVMSRLGIEILVHLDGKRLVSTSVKRGVQYLEADDNGTVLSFTKASDYAVSEMAEVVTDPADTTASSAASAADGDGAEAALSHRDVPAGAGLLFVVARFSDDPKIVGSQPPRQEFEISFQFEAPGDHEKKLAASLSKIVEPEAPIDPDNLVSMNPSSARPAFKCTVTGHSH